MDVFAGFHGHVLAAVQQLKHDGVVPADASIDGITLEPPKDSSHGDLATNAAMVLAKPAALPPRALAERIVPLLASNPNIDKAEIAGPGFINLTLAGSFWPRVLRMVLEGGDAYGKSAIGKGEPVEHRVCVGQPDRADACRTLPRRRLRRCARQSARLHRLRRHARVLCQ